MTKLERIKLEAVNDAYDFVKKYYPEFWDRVEERDIIHLLTIGHTLYKSDPQLLEATTKMRNIPTQ